MYWVVFQFFIQKYYTWQNNTFRCGIITTNNTMRAVTLNYGINQKLILITSSEYVFSLPTETVSFESSWFFLKKKEESFMSCNVSWCQFVYNRCLLQITSDYIRLTIFDRIFFSFSGSNAINWVKWKYRMRSIFVIFFSMWMLSVWDFNTSQVM